MDNQAIKETLARIEWEVNSIRSEIKEQEKSAVVDVELTQEEVNDVVKSFEYHARWACLRLEEVEERYSVYRKLKSLYKNY